LGRIWTCFSQFEGSGQKWNLKEFFGVLGVFELFGVIFGFKFEVVFSVLGLIFLV
jgi:hypothetical protein